MIRYSDNSSKSTLDTAVVSLQMTLDAAITLFTEIFAFIRWVSVLVYIYLYNCIFQPRTYVAA